MISLNHIGAKFTLDFCFSYLSRKMRVMHLSLCDNYNHSVSNRYKLIQYRPSFIDEKRTIHLSCFPGSNYFGIDKFIKSSRFIPSMSFLLYDKNICKFIGEIDVEKVFKTYCICNVGILPDYRGLGLSKFMINELLYNIHTNEVKDLYLVVKRDNNVAINLYSHFGFKFV